MRKLKRTIVWFTGFSDHNKRKKYFEDAYDMTTAAGCTFKNLNVEPLGNRKVKAMSGKMIETDAFDYAIIAEGTNEQLNLLTFACAVWLYRDSKTVDTIKSWEDIKKLNQDEMKTKLQMLDDE